MVDQTFIRSPEKLFIGGGWQDPSTGDTIDVTNSGDETVYTSVAEAKVADVDRAVAAAREAFDNGPWTRLSHAERAAHMRTLADEIDKRADAHAAIWTMEAGVLHSIALPSIQGLGSTYRKYADMGETFPFQERHPSHSGGQLALLVREPVGVVGAIVPWNGAPGLITNKVAPALIAGCTVVVKTSPEAPGSGYILAEACEAAGLPPGVVNVITADREASEHLVRHPGIDKITFTGSTGAGRRIASLCGERIARCTLELGGKSPAIILDDFDIETAAKTIAARATYLTGQVCWSLTRIIVTRGARHDALVEALAAEFAKVRVGDPFDPSSGMGPLAMDRQRKSVEGFIAKGIADGATLATGGARPAHLDRGYFIEPTVFGNVDNGTTIARDEIFGPVLTVIPASDEADAVLVANDTIYGLNAAVFTNDVDRAYTAARGIRAGTIGQNSARREFDLPFGGFKQSGIGREGGSEGLLSYLESKVVVLEGMPTNAGTVAN